ncbi:terminase gpP N-terminus-related DNA-binding protein [Dyadobacter chenhuakuii]|uniref:Helix-turn-helix domain-containing protein n=1 Tax=Dyadobacter chenhuakuii TaxID=2909339 RepID=A0ABY4XHC0_9BACT|nr:helix-turn-helix domain-containing protein [Dyadobacter chenhuakuii]MCF2495773.1 helix-turn-helix domain-containing protein [Dyadobacter chenhuakuii]USJ29804.1 helix-turn-helix domain-containing protein [Dyadobacter chenhuakuii]
MAKKTLTIKERAFNYHVKGLTFSEIGKLLDLSPRTVERYSQVDEWKARANQVVLPQRAKELRGRGFSCTTIAQMIGVSKSTVSNYLRRAEVKNKAK